MIAGAPPSTTTDTETLHQGWIDILRVTVIVGVIGSHASLIYALDVGWYYYERTAGTVGTALLAGIFSPGMLFGMGLLFLVAGLFTPPALARKGPGRFVTDRMWRLGIPSLAYLLVVNPLMNFVGDHAMGQGETVPDYLRRTYGDDVEFGIAWFMVALLGFSIATAVWRRRHPDPGEQRPLRLLHLARVAGFVALASFLVRLVWPFLDTGAVWTLNLWEYPQMAAMFAVGTLAAERGWLVHGLAPSIRRACGWAGVVGVVLAALLGIAMTLSDDPEPFLGGMRPEALLIPIVEAILTLGLSLWAVDWLRRRWNRRGRLAAALGRASFGAYLAHAPITVLVAIALRTIPIPAEAKFAIVFVVTVAAAFAIGWLATRSPRAGHIL